MKIVILVPLFPPKWISGTEIATYNIAKYLSKRGHEVHVITTLDNGLANTSVENGFNVHRINSTRIPFVSTIIFSIKSIFMIKAINPNVIHSQSIFRAGLACYIQSFFLNKPYIVYCRGSDIYKNWPFKNILVRLIFNKADALIALTEDMKNEGKKYCNKDFYVIPNGIDIAKYKNIDKSNLKKDLGLSNDSNIIIYVGRLNPIKGVRYLIEAISLIDYNKYNIKLLIIGDGEEKQKLIRLANELHLEKTVFFIGKIPNDDIPKYMAISNFFVLPSLSEGFPNVVLEAMASGLPIIATNIRGLPDIIKERKNGFLVKPEDPRDIANKIILLLEDDCLMKTIAINNKLTVTDYTWEKVVEKLEIVYKKVCNVTINSNKLNTSNK